jgi:heme-binding protein
VDDPAVERILVDSCYACHSDRRTDPWYAHLAPSSWSSRGRVVLDFSAWQSQPPEKQKAELAAISAVVRDGYMPLKDYTFFNRAAKLSDEQKQALVRWADAAAAH